MTFGHEAKALFALDGNAVFLNHGSFGAVPRRVAAAQTAWRETIERQPVDFMARRLEGELAAARGRLGDFVGKGAGRLVFVDNATTGVNAVLRSLSWQAGSEILFLDHVYGAVRRTLEFLRDRHAVVLNEVRVPLPVTDANEVVAAVTRAIGGKTRLAVIDHIASPSAIVMPVAEIAAACRAAGVSLLIDGAHAPGMVDLDIAEIGCDWYAGNCHKWLCAPRGAGFLWAAAERAEDLHPTVISHGYGQGLEVEFDWTGTRDFTPWLSVPAAIDFVDGLDPAALYPRNHRLAAAAGAMLAEDWGTAVSAPPALTGSMATVDLPIAAEATRAAGEAINRRLWETHRIEVPVLPFQERLRVRVSAHVYNEMADYEALSRAVSALAAS